MNTNGTHGVRRADQVEAGDWVVMPAMDGTSEVQRVDHVEVVGDDVVMRTSVTEWTTSASNAVVDMGPRFTVR